MSHHNHHQHSHGLGLIASGVGLQFFGLVWGLQVANTPFPRLALTAHIQAMATGAMLLGAGFVVKQTDLLDLSPTQCAIITIGLNTAWGAILSEVFNSYWGTSQMLSQAALAAGAKGALQWQEHILTVAHMAAAAMIPAFGILTYELLFGRKGFNLLGKGKKAVKDGKSH